MPNQIDLVLRLLIAAVLGSVIGLDRERLSWSAGLRTHMLVCVGSTLLMIVSAFGFSDILGTPHVELDPSRIAAQVVSGIGFLGAGSILLRGEIIRGLTTAASLWSVAAIGLAVGSGLYIPAIAATVIILIILAGIKPLERRFFESRQYRELHLVVERGSMNMPTLAQALGNDSARISQFVVQYDESTPGIDNIRIAFTRISGSEFAMIRTKIQKIKGIQKLEDNATAT